jgi:hypothetical protein
MDCTLARYMSSIIYYFLRGPSALAASQQLLAVA